MISTEIPVCQSAARSERRHQLWTVVLAAVGQFTVALDTLVVTTFAACTVIDPPRERMTDLAQRGQPQLEGSLTR